MTNEEVKKDAEEMIAYWQKQLRLQDYDVTVKVPEYDVKCCGQIYRSNVINTAIIEIRNPAMTPPTCAANTDIEYTCVHELLHLRLPYASFTKDSAEDDSFELGIELIAQALVNQRRGKVRE